jgi:hypothetical protein
MQTRLGAICVVGVFLAFGSIGWSQSASAPTSEPPRAAETTSESADSASKGRVTDLGRKIGQGGEDVGKGVARGTDDVARGTANGVGNLAHGRVGSAAAAVGRGVGGASKGIAVGTARGAAKVGEAVGSEFRKL